MTKAERKIIPYSADQKITNLDCLPRGTGAKFLECIRGESGALIAKAWRRSIPMARYEVLVAFPGTPKSL